jgi:ABC-2 type transport system permease protein
LNLSKVWAFAVYEVRRASARKKVLALAVITILLDTVPYYLLRTTRLSVLPVGSYPYLWVAGVFILQGFFFPFIALLIAAGSMSEEYEQGTAEVMLSKPVSRDEFLMGKFLGGFLLMSVVILLNAVLSVSSATFSFGSQLGLEILPPVVAAQVFSSLVFLSIAFMSGELIRRSSLSYITASAVFFVSYIVGIYLRLVYTLTGDPIYLSVNLYLPTTPVSSLPLLVGQPRLPDPAESILRAVGVASAETSIALSVALIAAYALGALAVTRIYFNWADVSKKVT